MWNLIEPLSCKITYILVAETPGGLAAIVYTNACIETRNVHRVSDVYDVITEAIVWTQ